MLGGEGGGRGERIGVDCLGEDFMGKGETRWKMGENIAGKGEGEGK